MLIVSNAGSPISIKLDRDGGTIITARVDIWRPIQTGSGWHLEQTLSYQQVTSRNETQQVSLAKGNYSAVVVCRVEESINGVFDLIVSANGSVVAKKSGNVDTTANPHDAEMYKNQFALEVH